MCLPWVTKRIIGKLFDNFLNEINHITFLKIILFEAVHLFEDEFKHF